MIGLGGQIDVDAVLGKRQCAQGLVARALVLSLRVQHHSRAEARSRFANVWKRG